MNRPRLSLLDRARLVVPGARAWLESHPPSQGVRVVFILLFATYALTASYDGGPRHNVDTEASALPAQQLVARGDIDLSAFQGQNPWIVEVDGRWVSNRPPGATIFAVPFYLLTAPVLQPEPHAIGPSAVAAIVITAAAMAFLYLALREVSTPRTSLLVALAFGLTTPTWSISATALWPHGPNQLLIAIGILTILRSQNSWLLLPVAVLAVLTRPLMVVPMGVIGIWLLVSKRWAQARWLAAGGMLGILSMALWTRWVFASPIEASPYTGGFLDSPATLTPMVYVERLGGALFDPTRGLFLVTPLVVLAIALGRPLAPSPRSECRVFALAGLAYFLAHLAFNRFNPDLQTNYRYWLETITLAAPLVAVGIDRGIESQLWRRGLAVAALWGFAFQVLHVSEFTSVFELAPDSLPWAANR